MKVLVTGGNGFLGSRLQMARPDWIYLSVSDYDLTSEDATRQMYSDIRPDAVLHLAAMVGGIGANINRQADFFYANTMINTNVVHQAHVHGVDRLLASLSTCAFPDECESYPFSEEDFFLGPPARTNFSYGYTKRSLQVHCLSYREQMGRNYSAFCPSNLYGPMDSKDLKTSHFVAALATRIARAKSGDSLTLWGTGRPLRQPLFVDDLVQIIPILLERHNNSIPLLVVPDENLSIADMAKIAVGVSGKEIEISFNQNKELDGQFRKDGSNKRLMELIPEFKFTSFEDGFARTYDWVCESDKK